MTANTGGMMKMRQLNLTDIKESNPNKMKVFIYKDENKDKIKVPSDHPNFTHDVYENMENKTKNGKWVYRYTGSTGWVNDYDNNS